MLDKILHHRLLTDGLEGNGVITAQNVEGMKGEMGVGGFYVGVEGHIKFDDGTAATFSSKLLDTSKVGDLDVGTIVPVRYDSDHKHAILDIAKLEADRAAHQEAAAEELARDNAAEIAAADAKLATGSSSHQN